MALRAFAGGRLFARTFGADAPRIVGLHGWGRSAADLDGVLTGLDALAVDLPGFGASPPPEEPWGAADYAAALDPVFDTLEAPPVILGHSFGGRVAVAVAARRPVAGLVLAGTPLLRLRPPAPASRRYRLLRAAHRRGLVSDVRMEALRRRSGSADYRAATGVMRDVLVRVVTETYESELARLTCPVRLVWGGEDREVPVEVAERARRILSDAGVAATLTVIEGVGHHVPLERPSALRAALDDLVP